MSQPQQDDEDGRRLTTNGFVEILVALVMLAVAAIVIYDANRLGFGWRDDGPAPGFFPFWVAVILGGSSLVNLVRAFTSSDRSETFVTVPQFGRVLTVLIPTLIYIAFIGGASIAGYSVPGLGIYLASFLFTALFMLIIGREGIIRSILVGAGLAIGMFLMFEKWFLVPLPKGPLEVMLGIG